MTIAAIINREHGETYHGNRFCDKLRKTGATVWTEGQVRAWGYRPCSARSSLNTRGLEDRCWTNEGYIGWQYGSD